MLLRKEVCVVFVCSTAREIMNVLIRNEGILISCFIVFVVPSQQRQSQYRYIHVLGASV